LEVAFYKFYQKFSDKSFPFKTKNSPTFWMEVGDFITGNSYINVSTDRKLNLRSENPIFTNKGFLYKKVYLYSKGSDKVENSFEFHNIEQLIKIIILENSTSDQEQIQEKLLTYGTIDEIPEKRGRGAHPPSDLFEIKYEESLEIGQKSKKTVKNEEEEPIKIFLKALVAQEWSMYCFWEQTQQTEENNGHKTYGIKQSLVKFTNEVIKIANTESLGQKSFYIGTYKLFIKDNHFYIETNALTLNGENLDSHLRIILYFGNKGIDEIGLGVYYNVRSSGALHSGTLIFSKISILSVKNYHRLKQEHCIVHTDWNEFDDILIKTYFERRDLNLIKVPNISTRYSRGELEDVLETLKSKRNTDIRLFKYYCFFSIPLTFDVDNDGNDCYIQNRKLALKIEKLLIRNKFIKPQNYLACRKDKTKYLFENHSKTGNVNDTLNSIAESQYFVLIYPKMIYPQKQNHANKDNNDNSRHQTSISFAIIEIGYALGLGKKVIILCESTEMNHLPKGLKALLNESVFIFPFEMRNIKALVQDLNTNELKKVFSDN
jgi:hypothetical protein